MQVRGVSFSLIAFAAALVFACGAMVVFLFHQSQAGQKVAALQQAVRSQSFAVVAPAQPILTEPEVLGASTNEAFVATSTSVESTVAEVQKPPPPPPPAGPELVSLSSQNAPAGATITIRGKDLSGAQAYLSVGGQALALPTGGSDSALNFIVPQGVPPGHYQLFVTQNGATSGPLDFFVR
jgi:hypothetical protein